MPAAMNAVPTPTPVHPSVECRLDPEDAPPAPLGPVSSAGGSGSVVGALVAGGVLGAAVRGAAAVAAVGAFCRSSKTLSASSTSRRSPSSPGAVKLSLKVNSALVDGRPRVQRWSSATTCLALLERFTL